jgi:hypothetical protein
MWNLIPNQNGNQVMSMFQNDMMSGSSVPKDTGLKKTPWNIDEEQIF